MLTTLTLTLTPPPNTHLTVNISSLLQGVLMENIDTDYATILHNGALQPYSHHLQINQSSVNWTIHTLTQTAYEQIILPMLRDEVTTIYLRHKNIHLTIHDKKLSQITYDQLRQNKYFTPQNRVQTLQFLTPTAFKSQGEYIFYPTVHFLFQSLMMKYDSFSDDANLFGQAVMDHFEENIKITRYKLRSYNFGLEGTKIPSFLGEITIKMNGDQNLVNLANYLLAFGEFSGVGIKCSIGMGGIKVTDQYRK